MAKRDFPAEGFENNQPGNLNPALPSDQPQPRVSRTRRSVPSVEVVVSDALAPNSDHPLAGLSRSERQHQRLLKLAEILAEEAKRKAAEQVSKGEEEIQ